MQIRKWLALLVSAALALSLLAGCGGESVASALLKLLDGRYPNISIEIDPELEADLRQAIRKAEAENAGDDDAAIRAALETALGSTITFRYLGDGQKGDTAFDLVFYAGSDPDKAAQAAYSQWNLVFANVPADGQYDTALAMVETNSGIWMLVKATVEKAGSRDDDDDDDEPEEPEDLGYIVDGKGNYTVNDSDGLQNLLTGQANEAQEITAARAGGFKDVTIELAAGNYSVDSTFTTPFKGTLKGKSKESTTINIAGDCNGLFKQIESNGKVENITFDVQTDITEIYTDVDNRCAGAVAGVNHGNITNCDVTINGGCTIQATSDGISAADAGGLVGLNDGTITNCTVTINGSISATGKTIANAGGIVGTNESGHEISGCKVTISGGSITATNGNGDVCAGGIAGENQGTISNCSVNGGDAAPGKDDPADISAANGDNIICAGGIAGCNRKTGTVKDCSVSCCKIEARGYGEPIAAGGIVGLNESDNVACGPATDYYITATAGTNTATATGETTTDSTQVGRAHAGAKIGDNNGAGPVGK